MAFRQSLQSLRERIRDIVDEARGTKEDALNSAKTLRPRPLKNILNRRLRKNDK